MAEQALRVLVDKEAYKKALGEMDSQLYQLTNKRDQLRRDIERLKTGKTYSGSGVATSIKKAEQTLESIGELVIRITGYRSIIQRELDNIEGSIQEFESGINDIEIPSFFN